MDGGQLVSVFFFSFHLRMKNLKEKLGGKGDGGVGGREREEKGWLTDVYIISRELE